MCRGIPGAWGCDSVRYQMRLSGPILHGIDMHLGIPRVEFDKLTDSGLGEDSSVVHRPGHVCPCPPVGAFAARGVV